MNLQSIAQDVAKLEKALKIVEKTENYIHFRKATLILELCAEINRLKEKADRQKEILTQLQTN